MSGVFARCDTNRKKFFCQDVEKSGLYQWPYYFFMNPPGHLGFTKKQYDQIRSPDFSTSWHHWGSKFTSFPKSSQVDAPHAELKLVTCEAVDTTTGQKRRNSSVRRSRQTRTRSQTRTWSHQMRTRTRSDLPGQIIKSLISSRWFFL